MAAGTGPFGPPQVDAGGRREEDRALCGLARSSREKRLVAGGLHLWQRRVRRQQQVELEEIGARSHGWCPYERLEVVGEAKVPPRLQCQRHRWLPGAVVG